MQPAQVLTDPATERVHISVCLCTLKRTEGLRRLLDSLSRQRNAPPFEVIVVDHDPAASARPIAASFAPCLNLRYVTESKPGLAAVRNRSVSEARGTFLAFADDDEVVSETWLATLHRVQEQTGAAVVVGPQRFSFDPRVPRAIRECRTFFRAPLPEGSTVPWYRASTGNAYVRRAALPDPVAPFQEHYATTGGEDVDCFKSIADAGHPMVAAGPGAEVTEYRDYSRACYAWVMRRSLRNGGNLADLQWRQATRRERLQLGFRALFKGLSDYRQARRVAPINALAFVERSIDAGEQLGRFLSVLGYRYHEYRARR